MSKLIYAAFLFAAVALCASCKDDDGPVDPVGPNPPTPEEMSVSIEQNAVTECTIDVTVGNKGGTRCALVWAEDGQTLPNDTAAFKTGVRIQVDKVEKKTIAPLKANTLYHVKAVVRDEEGNFESKKLEITTTSEKPEADTTVTTTYARARYFPVYNQILPQFELTLSTVGFSTLNPGVTGEGEVITLNLFVASDIGSDFIPDGTYLSAATKDAMTALATSFQYGVADMNGRIVSVTDAHTARATVERTGTGYKIFIRAYMEDGRVLYCNYDGPISIQTL